MARPAPRRRARPSQLLAAAALLVLAAPASARPADDADDRQLAALFAGVEAVRAGHPANAIRQLAPLVEREPLLGDYVRHFLARAYLGEARPAEARAELEALLDEHPRSLFADDAQLELAELHRELGACPRAVPLYLLVRERSAKGEDGARAGLGLAACLVEAGRVLDARGVLANVREARPGTAIGLEARDRLRALEAAHPEIVPARAAEGDLAEARLLAREGSIEEARRLALGVAAGGAAAELTTEAHETLATVERHAGRSAERERWLERVLADAPGAAAGRRAAMALIGLRWNQNRHGDALAAADALLATGPPARTDRSARYLKARILAERGDRDAAAVLMSELARAPGVRHEDALWHWCWLSFREGPARAAVEACDEARRRAPPGFERNRLVYWLAQATEADGDVARARLLLEGLAETDPEGFYGLYARAALAGGPLVALPFRSSGTPAPLVAASATARDPEAPAEPDFLPGDARTRIRVKKAARLERAFLPTLAAGELDALRRGARLGLEAQLWLAERFHALGAHHLALRCGLAANGLARGADEQARVDRWRYPLAYPRDVRAAAEREPIDPMLVLAIMRNESSFDPRALSPADARGLMQIIPPTGQRVAAMLGRRLETEQLYEPATNIRLGSHYLARLLARYDGDLFRAVAAYNAGEAAVDRWTARHPGLAGPAWVEEIAYDETRNYVRRVVRDLVVYRDLYGSERAPRGLPKM